MDITKSVTQNIELENLVSLWYVYDAVDGVNYTVNYINSSNKCLLHTLNRYDDDDDCFYIALFSALEQTQCARFYPSE